MRSKLSLRLVGLMVVLAAGAGVARGQQFIRGPRVAQGPNGINIPYQQVDGQGITWMINFGGTVQESGPQPVTSQGEMLSVNGVNINNNGAMNSAQLDPKTGEVVLDNINAGACTVTRRILISKTDSSIRYVDIFKNPSGQPIVCTVQFQSIVNFGIMNSAVVTDPKKSQNAIGWVATTQLNRALVEMYAGKGSKVVPTINNQNGNNVSQANFSLNIPAGKSVALLHFLALATNQDQGQQLIINQNEGKLVSALTTEVRKIIVNYPSSGGIAGDYEVLRGDIFDVVETHGGDLYRGTLQAQTYKLSTFYGDIELSPDQVIGIINVGEYRPRQLIVTSDGQVFGGNLAAPNVDLQLSSGQMIHVPLANVSRVGYRKRQGEPDEWKFDQAFIALRTGDRVKVNMPAGPIEIATRYGMLKLDPSAIASIAFQAEDSRVHEIYLTDGSRFAGLASAPYFDMSLTTTASAKPVRFPASSIVRMQLNPAPGDPDPSSPSISLLNDDLLVGVLIGQIKLDTAFDTLQINAPEIRKLSHTAPGSAEIQVELWDSTTVSGQLEDPNLHCKLQSGMGIDVPMSLLAEYNQPLPTPSAATIDKIKSLVADLNAADWTQRQSAQSSLIAMGTSVLSVLRDMRSAQTTEGKAGIDAVVKQLWKGTFPFPDAPATQPAQ